MTQNPSKVICQFMANIVCGENDDVERSYGWCMGGDNSCLEYVNSVDANGSTNLVYIPFDINSYNFKEFIEIFDFVFFKIENLHTL